MAPSPTGLFHIGSARTTLFNYLFARHHGGKFVLRIEDTDLERSQAEFEQNILDALRWLGLEWDEGPDIGGTFAPYHQSRRLDTYQQYAQKLLESGAAYPCFMTSAELTAEREAQVAAKQPPRYSGNSRDLTPEQIAAYREEGRPEVLRFQIESRQLTYNDLIKGEITVDTSLFGDPVILKADGMPTYNFAAVVDDHLMEISHVIRGEDHISNTPKQILIYEALGWQSPEFAHIPLILNSDRSKMSKRSGPVSVTAYQEQGYLSSALINYLVMLGWSPGNDQELFSLHDLVDKFELRQIQTSPAIFNLDKLDWFNGQYLRQLSLSELTEAVSPFIKAQIGESALADSNYLQKILPLVHERLQKLSDIGELIDFFFQEEISCETVLPTGKHSAKEGSQVLSDLADSLEKLPNWDIETIEKLLRNIVSEIGWKVGELFMLTRLSVTGKKATPPLFETIAVLGRDVSASRLRQAARTLQQS